MTAEEEGLWDPIGIVTREEIRHMKSRVLQFTATHIIDERDFVTPPMCKESWARWVVTDSAVFATQPGPRPPPQPRRRALPTLPVGEDEDDAWKGLGGALPWGRRLVFQPAGCANSESKKGARM